MGADDGILSILVQVECFGGISNPGSQSEVQFGQFSFFDDRETHIRHQRKSGSQHRIVKIDVLKRRSCMRIPVKLFPFPFAREIAAVKKFKGWNMTRNELIHILFMLVNKAVMKAETKCFGVNGSLRLSSQNEK